MDKKFVLLGAFIGICIGNVFCQTLTIRIENAEVANGLLMVGLYNNAGDYTDTYYLGQEITVTDRVMVIAFTDLPKGTYAVALYQDRNGNGKLDKNFLGIPTEKYGFSGNTMTPNYRRNSFDFNGDMAITVKLR